jgi:hypothetical protein
VEGQLEEAAGHDPGRKTRASPQGDEGESQTDGHESGHESVATACRRESRVTAYHRESDVTPASESSPSAAAAGGRQPDGESGKADGESGQDNSESGHGDGESRPAVEAKSREAADRETGAHLDDRANP